MASNIRWYTKDFDDRMKHLGVEIKNLSRRGANKIADEILRLSSFEVPHDTGLLQASGHVEPEDDGAIVGYNKVYAARLHEHPEYRFQKGRKGKYLEDPIKRNLSIFRKFITEQLEQLQ